MYDLIVIGGGPGGYIAAERAGARGLSVLLIEKDTLGGTCLNRGCIPTKALLNSAKLYAHALESANFGVTAQSVAFDWDVAMAWKNKTVKKLVDGVAASMRAAKVEVAKGTGMISALGEVRIIETQAVHKARNIILASGSSPMIPPIPGAKDNPSVVDSTALLSLASIPKSLAIIGGGVIGVEFASLFSSLGSKVVIVEMLPEILPFMDAEQAPILRRAIRKVSFKLNCKVEGIEGGKVSWDCGGNKDSIDADLVLMSVGRRLEVSGICESSLGLDADQRGIRVDEKMRTNLPGVYAVGDVTGKSLLAHSAYRMGEVAVDSILGGSQVMRYDAIPWAVYSLPEAAGAGLTEAQAKARDIETRCARVPLSYSGRFVAENGVAESGGAESGVAEKGAQAPGECKLVTEAKNGRVLGIHIVGPYASEMIWGASAAIEMEMRVQDLRETVFPHPTVSEALREAAWQLV